MPVGGWSSLLLRLLVFLVYDSKLLFFIVNWFLNNK